MSEDLELISDAALTAGRLALRLRDAGLRIAQKPGGSPVTNGDLAVDAMLTSRLRQARLDYGWLSEETADDPARLSARRLFMVDPIDGTRAYMRGKPWFVVSIAVVEAGRPIVAAIFAPAAGELYQAEEGRGARCNGAPIQASGQAALEACRMLGDINLFRKPDWEEPWPSMQVEQRNAIAYRMALTAAGQFDCVVSLGWKHDWDLAAGDLIAREAGACVSDTRGRPLVFNTPRAQNLGLICTAPGLHPLILPRTAPIHLATEA